MITSILTGVWSFLTSKLGLSAIVLAGVVFAGYQGYSAIYDAGAQSEKESAAKSIKVTQDEAKKKIDKAEADLAQIKKEREKWQADMDAAVKEAKEAQTGIINQLSAKLQAAETRKAALQSKLKELTAYVSPKADSDCVIPNGFVWLHDYSVQKAGPMAGSGSKDVDAASGVKLSEIAAVDSANFAECVERGEVIDAWQLWYSRNKTVYDAIMEKSK